jgi:hypothetical protein
MSRHKIVRSSLIAFGLLSFSSLAFARRPPALVEAEERADNASCVVAGAGYRDDLVRFEANAGPARETVARLGAGYRDTLARFGSRVVTEAVACQEPTHALRLSASR